jgi:hypothetical protein
VVHVVPLQWHQGIVFIISPKNRPVELGLGIGFCLPNRGSGRSLERKVGFAFSWLTATAGPRTTRS